MVGVGMVVVFGLLNVIGVEVFGKVEVFFIFGMWVILIIFGLCGILLFLVIYYFGWFGVLFDVSNFFGLFGYIGMVMFMFVGCELVMLMVLEIKKVYCMIFRVMVFGFLVVVGCMFFYGVVINW